ncbi:carbohydrate ABC transporter permease [Cohnella silvisoli]|uniref:Carbohydrate ABC transporter permease n=1 Tax=Cohnella silvisoli TaxID=2873699 RepID=A0ABV1KTD6_9BACL|nr:carbohydrate ABC transporter permease [Cohnella silvisoli]MCD9021493.1 carbohydrate ABC transporter permease [Cohnella silvisoli]
MRVKSIAFHSINYVLFGSFAFICIYPFYYLLLVSVSNSDAVSSGLVVLWPSGFNVEAYKRVFVYKGITEAFFISVSRALAGTVVTLFFSSMFAYVLTKKELFGRVFMYRSTVFALYISAGLIPWFITMKQLGLADNYLLYILPTAISPFLLILIKTYLEQISPHLEESAMMDGAGYFTVFMWIMMPVSVPVLAAVGVFSAVTQWNSWQDNFYLVNNPHLQTIQLILINFLREADAFSNPANMNDLLANASRQRISPFSLKTTIAVVSIVPVMLFYPFLQRYFVKGIMVGAIKG